MRCLNYLCLHLMFLVSATVTYAGAMGQIQSSTKYDGLYAGLDVGVSNLSDSQSVPGSAQDFSATGYVGGGVIGYDLTVKDRFKLGVEWFMNANSLRADAIKYSPTLNTSFYAKSKYNVGVRFLPGYELSQETEAHIILGYSNAQFQVRDNGYYGYINKTFNCNGFQSGFGLKTNLARNLYLRGDALYTTYSRNSSVGLSTYNPGTLGAYNNTFSTVEADLTLIYKFDIGNRND